MEIEDTVASFANCVLNPYKPSSSWNLTVRSHSRIREDPPARPVHVTTIHPELVRVDVAHNGETAAFHIEAAGTSTFKIGMTMNDVATVIVDGITTSTSGAFVRRKFEDFERTNARAGKLARTLLMRVGGCPATIVARHQRRAAKRIGRSVNAVNAQRVARICLDAVRKV